MQIGGRDRPDPPLSSRCERGRLIIGGSCSDDLVTVLVHGSCRCGGHLNF